MKKKRRKNVIHHVTCRIEMKEFSVKLIWQKQILIKNEKTAKSSELFQLNWGKEMKLNS